MDEFSIPVVVLRGLPYIELEKAIVAGFRDNDSMKRSEKLAGIGL